MNTQVKFVCMVALVSLSGQLFANESGFWKLDDAKGQELKNSINAKESGWLGKAKAKDASDAKFIMDGSRKVLSFEPGKCAIIPNGKYSDFSKAKAFSIQLWFKPMIDFAGKIGRVQLLTKGADSNPNNWQLRMRYDYRTKKNMLDFFIRYGKDKTYSLNAPIGDLADKWTRATVVGDGKNLKLFLNGKIVASIKCQIIPKTNPYPLKLGVYAFGGKFGFTGSMKDLKIYKTAIIPTPVKVAQNGKVLLKSNFKNASAAQRWTPVNGKWLLKNGSYCELSDAESIEGVWSVSGKSKWKNYCLSAAIECVDNIGDVLLATGWKDIKNHYEINHKRHSTGMIELSIIQVKNGKRTTLAQIDSSSIQLPSPEKKNC